MTKQFKIGEYALGGIIKATVKNHDVKIESLDWYTKKEVQLKKFKLMEQHEIMMYLNEITSSFFADKVLNWINQ